MDVINNGQLKSLDGVDARIKHVGDPCIYCSKTTESIEYKGKCRAFDDVRSPLAGERFVGLRGQIEVARFDFTEQEFAVFA